ncbi:hypothetical protein KPH14_008925 [Odynerus spinipes]|uniref:Death domain-containing protein n=1 Tax=Odynerus spinipes TaxID=1348599 RepID=A0AAD9RN72_9HYME|nr:hypothetical protein KPH14_008925 [Odynerus spinipes]
MYLNDNIQPSTSNHDQETCDQTRAPNSYTPKLNKISDLSGSCMHKAAHETQHNYTTQENSLYDKESKLKQIVVLKICEQLGRSWRDVCRYMDLKEYQIDEIQNKYPYNLKEQSFQALQICISEYDSNWKINILHALEKGRRKDIKEFVEKILLCKEM